MQTLQKKTPLKKSSLNLSGPLLTCAVFLFVAIGCGQAVAATETAAISGAEQAPAIDMERYEPDQTDWSEKAISKYEKEKNHGPPPIALLTIERLNIKAPVYFGTDRVTLDRGLGWVEGTTYLGEVGNIGLSGHRDGFFRPLKDIRLGDGIEVQTPAGVQLFEVSEITIVDALEVSVLDPTETTVLTLITCYPFYYQGYAPDRYIVRAIPVGSDANGVEFNARIRAKAPPASASQ